METLSIRNFAGLRDVSFPLRPVTVFIGPQATGKSVIAKLLYFFRGLPGAMLEISNDPQGWARYHRQAAERFMRFFPVDTWSGNLFTVAHAQGNWSVEVTGHRRTGESAPEVIFSNGWEDVFARLQSRGSPDEEDHSGSGEAEARRPRSLIRSEMGHRTVFEQIFITAGRSFFAQVVASIFSQLREGGKLDPFVVEFGAFLERTRILLRQRGFYGAVPGHNRRLSPDQPSLASLRKTMADVLRGRLVWEDGDEYIRTSDERKIPVAMASSGQQEALPLLLLLSRFFLLHHRWGRSIYVEEPEAHLFPTAQRCVIDLMIETFNLRHGRMELVLTTHSPYVLTALNNLLKAGQRYAEADAPLKEKLAAVIPETRALRVEHLAAYALDGGEVSNIVDEESGLIDAAAIDTVSEILAEQFHKILWEGR